MDDLYIWEINGVRLEVDAEDAEFMERYKRAEDLMKISDTEAKTELEAIREYCLKYRIFYDNLFGEGTSEKIFNGIPDNRRKYDDIFIKLLERMMEQRIQSKLRLVGAMKKYVPGR